MLLLAYAVMITIGWIGLSVYLLYNRSRVKALKDVTLKNRTEFPEVVIIIAIRNEETNLAEALQSVCQLQYPHFRILLINDRSTDKTPILIEDFAARYPFITTKHITELPPGWLGKNDALYQGYKASSEEWMLFTDADVLFHPLALKKAMQNVQEKRLEHLTVLPDVQSRSQLLNSALSTFTLMIETRQRPWAIKDPKSSASLGIGAFNLVHRKAYEKAGTHQAIALRPDDDLKLGLRIKASGGKQDALYGKDHVGLEWYTSVAEFRQGLMKNMFSIYNYNFFKMLLFGVLPTLFVFVVPLPMLLLFGGNIEKLLAAIILLCQILLFSLNKYARTKWWHTLLIPYAGAVMVYIMLKAGLLTLQQKGIYWRESFYPLKELKKSK